MTTGLGFPFPGDSDYPTGADVPRAVRELAEAVDDFLTGTYKLVSIRYITTGTTTFEPTAGVDALYVDCVGGGGAGGGCTAGATNSAAGGGGGGGGYAAKWVTTMKHPFTVAIGAGGTGSSGSDGGGGGTTSFDSPAVCSANGGNGGKQRTVTTPPAMGGEGGAGGAGDTGDVLSRGQPGVFGVMQAAAQSGQGTGGNSMFGGGAKGLINVQSSGANAFGYGGGGSGGSIVSGGASVAGGNGTPGFIRVWEFRGATSGGA